MSFTFFTRNKCVLSCIFDGIFNVFDMRNKYIRNHVIVLSFISLTFLFQEMAWKLPWEMPLEKPWKMALEMA